MKRIEQRPVRGAVLFINLISQRCALPALSFKPRKARE